MASRTTQLGSTTIPITYLARVARKVALSASTAADPELLDPRGDLSPVGDDDSPDPYDLLASCVTRAERGWREACEMIVLGEGFVYLADNTDTARDKLLRSIRTSYYALNLAAELKSVHRVKTVEQIDAETRAIIKDACLEETKEPALYHYCVDYGCNP